METIEKEISIPIYEITLTGELSIPERAKGIVVFAHGSGSSRHSSRNKYVARSLQDEGFATLLFDLLTVKEDEDYNTRFDIDLLTDRLIKVTDWLKTEPETGDLNIGYFGASTGAAATLNAAADLGNSIIAAIVSRGGRPDLADINLPEVKSPTMLIVGGLDTQVIDLNQKAFSMIGALKEIVIVPGASHLFEEPGKLEEVANLAIQWFNKYLFTVVE
ncbi:dienelactone hydrolase family protein [Albibacterium bauzanense]|uniref:Dienelactone hydrolase n=1 Tax=Albibacterium bauzanense TaxID=653929 RepID=A0A4R1M3X9_9SPHI|nr:alpha/beta fold hydrolase [Albibacterium bauzanense]TCK85584.1 dienelactone hydrolase [Albibacterium bauzanense]